MPLYGRVEHAADRSGGYNPMWLDWKIVIGVPHDMLIPGYGGRTVNYLRLFSARASQDVDMERLQPGRLLPRRPAEGAVGNDLQSPLSHAEFAAGRELRLVQEYFLAACAVRDIVRRYRRDHATFDTFADKVAVQLNDTHPTLAITELMRILVDENDLAWDRAWEICTAVFAYTNHTLMAEALEKWPVPLIEQRAAAPPADHLRNQSPLPGRGGPQTAGRRRDCCGARR